MSRASTLPFTGVSSAVLRLAGLAVGASLTGLTVIRTTVSTTPPLPSSMVTVNESGPL